MEYVDDTAANIVLAASDGDSIHRITQKIGGTYSWVYSWIERLEEIGVVERNEGVYVTAPDVREGYARVVEAISRQTPPTINEAYVLPHFAQMEFAYTKIDAVYVWTHGGYQIARRADAYPVFLGVFARRTSIGGSPFSSGTAFRPPSTNAMTASSTTLQAPFTTACVRPPNNLTESGWTALQ